eukprot:COSAG02_NODE_542_length_20590_cov_9.193060_9_plen_76_part_01
MSSVLFIVHARTMNSRDSLNAGFRPMSSWVEFFTDPAELHGLRGLLRVASSVGLWVRHMHAAARARRRAGAAAGRV